ncbi:MAG: carbon-nitrogen hydrolase family protein [Anaerolineae bacterium]|nr:carbon-nitrogen hydrolase family protein [Anaerolineae bacterium]MCX8066462.1 carbon-nitrogen hydrolase family protein [Anaerolineae bacterium]
MEITVATVQMQPVLGQMEENLAKMGEFIRRIATEQPVDLIVFPELATTGYEVGPRFPQMAQLVPGPAVNILAQRAADYGVHVAFGMATKEKVESIIYNSAILIGPDGEVLGQYNKIHLRGEERMAFRPGYRLPVFETDFGPVGLMVGWDLAFPEVARCLVLDGALVLAVLANWEEPHQEEWRTYLRARAMENAVFVAAANRIGEEPSYTFFGQSAIIGPTGHVYAIAEEPVEGYVVARLNLDELRHQREETQILQCRQPTTYRAIVRKY